MTATALEPPSVAAAVFGEALPQLLSYAALLAGPAVERGLLGPREPSRLWERHLLNCAGLTALVPPGAVALDLGSGAGLPGLVLALQRPDVTVLLVEPLLRRAGFLTEVVEALGLRTAVVRRSRAEDLAGTVEVDVVLARAVAPVDRLAGWAMPLLHQGGRLLALKGERAEAELLAARQVLPRLGADAGQVVEIGDTALMTEARVVVVERLAQHRPATGPGRPADRSGHARPTARPAGRRQGRR